MLQGNQSNKEPKVFSIQVSGIKCTGCAGKIKTKLNDCLKEEEEPNFKVSVDVLRENIILTIFREQSALKAMEKLKEIGYPPVRDAVLLSGGEQSFRSVVFVVSKDQSAKIEEAMAALTVPGVKWKITQEEEKLKLKIHYNCQIVKGRELADHIQTYCPSYEIFNQRVDSFSSRKPHTSDGPPIIKTIVLCIFFLFFNMILPFTGMWFHHLVTFPERMGIFSLAVIVNTIATIYVMKSYAQGFIKRAYGNWKADGSTNMETLIALGSLSAFGLFIFFMFRYTIETFNGEMMDAGRAIMDINDALTSASIIVLVVTIGKYYEGRVKAKIDKMTQEIFPESTLFANMMVQHAEIKSRVMMSIGRLKNYDVSLLEKNDLIRLAPGRVLVDLIIINGEVKAIQSANSGCQDVVLLQEGERLQSGAQVIEVNGDCLAQVENVFQKSMLIEIGTQIKHSQNMESSTQSGIQAVCKKIASVFVRGVIIFSILTMVVWTIILEFGWAEVDMCTICWVVQRGIGVLVASCPCALGLAVPSVVAIVLNLATKSGILIKNNSVFQKMKRAKNIAFDKTGTLFTRISSISQQSFFNQAPPAKTWQLVALLQKELRHPLAEILYKEAFQRSKEVGKNDGYLLAGKVEVMKDGIIGRVRDKAKSQNIDIMIGNKNLLESNGIHVPIYEKTTDASTELFVCADKVVQMVILLNTHSNLRPEAGRVVSLLQSQKMSVHILSGDSAQSVSKLATTLCLPPQNLHPEHSAFMKMQWIKECQTGGDQVVMIGDGLNDIPCLQQAGIGISINAKSQLNINAADVVILSQNLYKILALIRFVRKGNLFINLNLFWAFSYNIIIMPIVAGVFYKWDIFVSPIASSIAMSLSSLIVVGFSHLLTCFKYDESLGNGESEKKPKHKKRNEIPMTDKMQDTAESASGVKKYIELQQEFAEGII